ncbi:MAG: hypothetical protein IPN76_32040 [Saprospiraceae bacterium]|nr:hypothetical protein [Saprospiraceae bacterium]
MKKRTDTFMQKAGRAFFAFLMTSILIPALFAQSVWTGTGSKQWEDANSWSGGVPGPGMTATINACSKCPIINNAVPSVKSLTIMPGASVKMNGNGMLVIENLPDGLVKVEAGGFLEIKNNAVLQTNRMDNLGTVENAGTIVAKRIDNYLKFINKGNMTLDNPTDYAFINIPNDPNVQLDNYGQITITNSFIVVYGVLNNYGKLFIDNGNSVHSTVVEHIGTFNNFATGKVTLTNCQYIGFLNSGKLFNYGRFEIDGSENYGLIHTYQPASIVENYATGVISVKNTLKNGIYNSSNFTNAGKITVEHSGNSPLYNDGAGNSNFVNTGELKIKSSISSIENRGVFNSSGKITIEGCNNGIANFKELTNSGIIVVKPNATTPILNIGLVNLGSEASATISNSGSMQFVNTEKGLEVGGGTTLTNAGSIEVLGNGGTNTGIENSGTIYNLGTGKITLANSKDIGLLNITNAIFINSGNLLIDKVVQRYGIVNGANAGYLANDLTGTILIKNTADYGIYNLFAIYNSGKLTIQAAGTDAVYNYYPSGYFFIQPCGELNVGNRINNGQYLQNEGLLRSTYNGVHINTGTLLNMAVIEDFNNAFKGVPFNNNAFRIRPISGTVGSVIHNAVEAGGVPPITIGSTWYKDPNMTQSAGTFNSVLNTFTPTLGVGTHTLYFTVKDIPNNCIKTVSIKVNIANAMIGSGEKAKPDIVLFNYPNPFVNETRIKLSLPFDATGKLVVFDQFGRLVSVVYEGELSEGELYEFSVDANTMQVANYVATLILDTGKTYSMRMVKADNF